MTKPTSSERITVENFMNNRLVTIDSDSSVADAAQTMVENKTSSILVTKNDKIVGIATEIDIVKIAAKGVPLDGVTIGSLMSSPLASIPKQSSVEELAESMIKKRVRHLAVSDNDEIVGIASVSDIARYLKQKLTSKEAESLLEAISPTDEERERLFW